jgi:hypothetical protein
MPTIEDSTSSLQTPTVGKAFRDQRGMRFGGCLHQMRTDPLGLYTRTWREYEEDFIQCEKKTRPGGAVQLTLDKVC